MELLETFLDTLSPELLLAKFDEIDSDIGDIEQHMEGINQKLAESKTEAEIDEQKKRLIRYEKELVLLIKLTDVIRNKLVKYLNANKKIEKKNIKK